MKFNPHLEIGEVIQNKHLVNIFRCGNMGGMRRSKTTGTLVIISDSTKGLYHDEWREGILHYTGVGKVGDQVLQGTQNKTLYDSDIECQTLISRDNTHRKYIFHPHNPRISGFTSRLWKFCSHFVATNFSEL